MDAEVSSSTDTVEVQVNNLNNNPDDEISTTWQNSVSLRSAYQPDDDWIIPLSNLVKFGRLFCFSNPDVCVYYYMMVFPRFTNDDVNNYLVNLIPNSLLGNIKYFRVVENLTDKINETVANDEKQIYMLYLKVFRTLGNDSSQPIVEFCRKFDLKSLKTVHMATSTKDDELRETPALMLAKSCSAILSDHGYMMLYGTNILFRNYDQFSLFKSRVSETLLNKIEERFRILEDVDGGETLRLSCHIDNVEAYVTLASIQASWTFDTDVTTKFINIPIEPYPYDALLKINRLCIVIYIPEASTTTARSKRVYDDINERITMSIIQSIQYNDGGGDGQRYPAHIVSNFTNFPLVPYNPVYRHVRFDMYHFHKYLRRHLQMNEWLYLQATLMDIPKIFEFSFVIFRPILCAIPIIKYGQIAYTLTKFWSPEDVIELHGYIHSGCSRSQVVQYFRSDKKVICYRIFNGFIARIIEDIDAANELYERYVALLHLWIGTYRFIDDVQMIKTWTCEEHEQLERLYRTNGSPSSVTIAVEKYLKRAINSVDKFYILRNTFSCKTNLLNVSEVSEPTKIFSLVFDYPVKACELLVNQNIVHEEVDSPLTNFKTVESLEIADRLFGVDCRKDLLEISRDKYVLQLLKIPAVVFVGLNWDEKDAVKLTKFHDKLSRNVLHTIQSILCHRIIKECVVGFSSEGRSR